MEMEKAFPYFKPFTDQSRSITYYSIYPFISKYYPMQMPFCD